MKSNTKRHIFSAILLLSFFGFFVAEAEASTFFLNPASGDFSVGSTFNVSVLLNTEGKSVNALTASLSFPPDKLQIVSPSIGNSIIGVWTVPPKFNNAVGTIELEGGIPKGNISSRGVVTNITFRVKSPGQALVKFLDNSQVFLNDGLATEDLRQANNGTYDLRLPAPAGPAVVSTTHPDQVSWYPGSSAQLEFSNDGVEGYSYAISTDPTLTPDNISEGTKPSIIYNNLTDGTYYFHVKALRGGVWGGTTHFIIKIDRTPPAIFPIEVLPSSRTTEKKPIIQFHTTDADSGVDHYELRLEPLSGSFYDNPTNDTSFFFETESPYVTAPLALGSYDIIVRAYDKANNFQEATKRLTITTPFFKVISNEGIQIRDGLIVPWMWVWIIGFLALLFLGQGAFKVLSWHKEVHMMHLGKKLPEELSKNLSLLKKYQDKYLKSLAVLLTIFSFWSVFVESSEPAQAANLELTPPLITTISKDISDKEIFYIGGKTDVPNEEVVLYSQNLSSGETLSQIVESDKNGDWFYRHNTFLSPGEYLLWVQSKIGDEFSPPSAEVRIMVKRTALTFGSNRLSYEAIYLIIISLLILAIVGLTLFIFYHLHHGRRKYKKMEKSIKEAEESVRRGFAVLRRDIEAELTIVRKNNPNGLSFEEKQKEAELLNDLNFAQKRIGKEIWEIQKDSW